MIKKTLFAWIGKTDFNAAAGLTDKGLGPIAQTAKTYSYSRIVLLNNYSDEDSSGYLEWLKGHCKSEIVHHPVTLTSPSDFAAIYLIAEKVVKEELSGPSKQTVPVFHLSPGTPAMQTVWILLSKAVFAEAELVQSSQEQGVVVVNLPFDISAEFTPAIAKAANEYLTKLVCALPPKAPEFAEIIHQCEEMKKLVARARIVALHEVPVLIEGETGTGKELFARAIHASGNRKQQPFIAVNCGAIPKDLFEAEFFGHAKGAFTGADKDRAGYFEMANNGTLFLDELGELSADAQVKILRVLNDGKLRRVGESIERNANFRIISATNRNLMTEVAAGRFRSDLFYRLAVAMLKLPPLRERQGDLGLLIYNLLDQVNKTMSKEGNYVSKTFSSNAKNLMLRHSWPGNARELLNTITRICVWCPEKNISEEDVRQALLPVATTESDDLLNRPMGEGFKLHEIHDFISSTYIQRALKETGRNKTKAAKLLGFENHQTLSNRMKALGVNQQG